MLRCGTCTEFEQELKPISVVVVFAKMRESGYWQSRPRDLLRGNIQLPHKIATFERQPGYIIDMLLRLIHNANLAGVAISHSASSSFLEMKFSSTSKISGDGLLAESNEKPSWILHSNSPQPTFGIAQLLFAKIIANSDQNDATFLPVTPKLTETSLARGLNLLLTTTFSRHSRLVGLPFWELPGTLMA